MTEATTRANGIELWYETFGEPADPPVLLIMGLGAQAIAWPDELCRRLAGARRFVIRYDNRDVGLSQYFDDVPDPYSLDDMAADAVGLLDALGIASAHVVGASMGGMIAQLVALDYPKRVRTLTSIMSSPGGADLEPPAPEVIAAIMQPPGRTREERVGAGIAFRRMLAAGGFPADDGYREQMVERAIDRAFHPAGTMRQAYAVATAPPRGPRLAGLTCPVLVLHGTADTLVPYSHGVATAKAVPGAILHTVDGMGHELPPSVWDEVVEALASHTSPPTE